MRTAFVLFALVGLARAGDEVLREAIVAATEGREEVRARSLEALDRIAKAPRPEVTGLPWVRVTQKGGRSVRAWKAGEDEKGVTIVAIDGRRSVIPAEKVEPADLREDVREVARAREARGFEFGVASESFRLHFAVVAAELGMAEEARALVARAVEARSDAFAALLDDMAWAAYRPALLAFSETGDRAAFLRTCKEIRAAHAGSRYDAQLDSLIGPLEREAPAPADPIALAVHRLRDVRGAPVGLHRPLLFALGGAKPTEADAVVALGAPAIPFLVAAIDDDTPTRALVARHRNLQPDLLLRRQDAAIECLERIAGCTFYGGICLSADTPERRASVVGNVQAWWFASGGASQAEGVRNQLWLREGNLTLRHHDLVKDLEVLAMLDGPEAVIDRAKALLAEEKDGLNGPARRMLDRIEPRVPVQEAFRNFRGNASRDGEYRYLLRYGDRATYEEIARRLEATDRLDPGPWSLGDQARSAAKHGRNWAIPILAHLLTKTAETGSRYIGTKQVSFSAADVAAELFEELVGKSFRYDPAGSGSDRAAARLRALRWWLDEGHRLLREKIAEDHPPTVPAGDLLLPDEAIAARVAAIGSEDKAVRRAAVAASGETTSFAVQRALLRALAIEADAPERARILRVLEARPSLWHVPTLAAVLEKDPDRSVRLLAAAIVGKAVGDRSISARLETRDAGLDAARRVAEDETAPPEVREASRGILDAR